MKYPASRELIADSVEAMVQAHGFDALVFIPTGDKLSRMLMVAGGSTFLHFYQRRAHAGRSIPGRPVSPSTL